MVKLYLCILFVVWCWLIYGYCLSGFCGCLFCVVDCSLCAYVGCFWFVGLIVLKLCSCMLLRWFCFCTLVVSLFGNVWLRVEVFTYAVAWLLVWCLCWLICCLIVLLVLVFGFLGLLFRCLMWWMYYVGLFVICFCWWCWFVVWFVWLDCALIVLLYLCSSLALDINYCLFNYGLFVIVCGLFCMFPSLWFAWECLFVLSLCCWVVLRLFVCCFYCLLIWIVIG